MAKLTMKCIGGPYGDACSSYKFSLSEELSLKEFMELLASNKNEWGSVYFRVFGEPVASYDHGEIIYHINDTSFLIEINGDAHGGWSLMDYIVTRKGENNGR